MTDLQVIDHGGVEVVDSREVARMIDVRHADLLEKVSSYCNYLANGKFRSLDFFIPGTYMDGQQKERPCYYLTKKGCDMVANKMTGEKGVLFTAAYVTAFEKMRERLTRALPQDFPTALRMLAEAEEHRLALAAQAEANRPKVLFADAVTTAHTSILVGELAKLLRQNGVDIGQNRLFNQLRQDGFLIRRHGSDYNMPTQKAMDMGLFEIKESSFATPDGVRITKTPKVTGKGQQYFINRFLGN